MGIFSSIKDAIFGSKAEAAPAPEAAAVEAAPAPVAIGAVDVEALMNEKAAAAGQKLNWRTSIVDLMKLLGLDASLSNRKELATELGYAGDMGDSATMNIWLHKKVMAELAANGGTVPADLLD